jgi:hypothetical protein
LIGEIVILQSHNDGNYTETTLDKFPNAHGDNNTWYRVKTENFHDGSLINVIHTKDKNLAIELYGYIIRRYGYMGG